MRTRDTQCGYGWISIALHWLTAAILLAMWTIGTMSQIAGPEGDASLVRLHTTVGVTMYALLWARIVWRIAVGHPGPRPGQAALMFPVAKFFHFLLLAALGTMLISGPLMVWAGGDAIEVFNFSIPSPFGELSDAERVLRSVHRMTASFIIIAIVLHVLAVFKHVIVNRDGTFDKIMIADGGRQDQPAGARQ